MTETNIQETSRIAYDEIKDEGIWSNQKETILQVVSTQGDSLRELCQKTGFEINAVSGRVNDLKKEGKLEHAQKRKCSISNRLINPVVKPSKGQSFFQF
ncbi:hypothetical protein [uncultured Mediterranean phage uvMED]|nr:hypothetical protein [uncultured Mediterranean phage uvMED]